jgi:TM2 domain-containing membrane protein YozV
MSQTTQDSLVVKDTITEKKIPKEKGPRRAAILSAIIPGAGQIYNRKYWKAPIVWGALGGLGYYFLKNQDQYTYYRSNLKKLVAGDSSVISTTGYNTDQLQSQKLLFRKRRDLLGFGIIAVYSIQIIDANVDAHLKTFDVSDDLSLHLHARPVFAGTALGAGLSLKLTFK